MRDDVLIIEGGQEDCRSRTGFPQQSYCTAVSEGRADVEAIQMRSNGLACGKLRASMNCMHCEWLEADSSRCPRAAQRMMPVCVLCTPRPTTLELRETACRAAGAALDAAGGTGPEIVEMVQRFRSTCIENANLGWRGVQ